VLDEAGFRVTAWPLNHPVECYGYRIEQHDKPGTLDAAQLIAEGVPPGPLFQRLKQGLTVELEDGRRIDGSRYSARQRRVRSWLFSAIPPPARRRGNWPAAWMSWFTR
jgi:ribonuclease BN (tRNA processing enzyme)